jgi:hypothetical protein
MNWRRASVLNLWLLFVVGGTACSRQAALHPVQGKVLFKGKPLANATVRFVPETEKKTEADIPLGDTQADGTFVLQTGEREGAPVGKYKVTVVLLEASKAKPDSMSMSEPEKVDRFRGAYANPTTTALSAEIKDGPNQLEPFDLK